MDIWMFGGVDVWVLLGIVGYCWRRLDEVVDEIVDNVMDKVVDKEGSGLGGG